eukprot:2724837-Pleurochrysis_carterae.AAC.1
MKSAPGSEHHGRAIEPRGQRSLPVGAGRRQRGTREWSRRANSWTEGKTEWRFAEWHEHAARRRVSSQASVARAGGGAESVDGGARAACRIRSRVRFCRHSERCCWSASAAISRGLSRSSSRAHSVPSSSR